MKREKLTELAARAAAEAGYAFHTGEAHEIGAVARVYPAAWMMPPVVGEMNGRQEGEVTYRMTMHLMTLSAIGGRETLWAAMERDALTIAASLARMAEVCDVQKVSCTPASRSLTVHGEVSVTLVCDVRMWYYN